MINLSDELIQAERRADLRRQADHRRLIRLATRSAPRVPRALDVALNRLGGWLIVWGCRLQSRYERVLQASTDRGPALSLNAGRLASETGGSTPCTG